MWLEKIYKKRQFAASAIYTMYLNFITSGEV